MNKLIYYYKIVRIIFDYYILTDRTKLILGELFLDIVGRLLRNKEYVELSKHIKYKLGKVPMKCELFEFNQEDIPKFDLQNKSITIVIPTRDHLKDLNICIGSINCKSTYQNYDIVVVDNQSDEYTKSWLYNCPYENVSVIPFDNEYNYAAIHNEVIPHCKGEYIIMLNNDTEVIEPTWIEQLIGPMLDNPINGMTGAKLLFADHTIQHCGVLYSDISGGFMHVNSHKCDAYPSTNEYMVYPAVTGACVAIRKDLYIELNGMDENLKVAYNDIDLCMKVDEAGYNILYTPYAKLYHYESKTRGYDTTIEKQMIEFKERTYFFDKWGSFINAHPQ